MWPTPAYKALFKLHFEKKSLSKTDLPSRSRAGQLHLCKFSKSAESGYLRGWAIPKPYIEWFFPFKHLSQLDECFNQKKVSQNRTKLQQTNNNHFSAKNKYLSIFETNFIKSEGKVRFGQFFSKWSSRRAVSDATKQTILSFQEIGQKCKMMVKIKFTPLSLSWPQNLSLLKGF